MKKNNKMIALLLSTALMISGMGIEGVGKTQAASRFQKAPAFRTASEGAVTATGGAIDEESPAPTDDVQDTEAPAPTDDVQDTEAPAPTDDVQDTEAPAPTDDVQETEIPTPSAIATLPPLQTQQPTIPPLQPTTPSAVSTSTAVSGPAMGALVTVGNLVYKVTKVAENSAAGEVKVKTVTDAAKNKKTLTVPEKVTVDGQSFKVTGIGERAFTGCTALTKITIKKNVKFIGVRAFQKVTTLKTVMMGEGVTTIKKLAFGGCSGIRNITLPGNVKLIGARAFYNCKKMKAVMIDSKKITTVKSKAFGNQKKGRYVVVPSGKKSLYQSLIKASGATSVKVYTY